MQVGSRYATRRAYFPYDLASLDGLARLHSDRAQVAVHGDQPFAVIDKDAVAVEEVVAGIDDLPFGGRLDGCARWGGDIHARVRVARLVVEYAAHARGARAYARDRRPQSQC